MNKKELNPGLDYVRMLQSKKESMFNHLKKDLEVVYRVFCLISPRMRFVGVMICMRRKRSANRSFL